MMTQLPTQFDVARRAKVSRGLVSLALANSPRVSAKTKKRILQAARSLGYVRNLGAAMLAADRALSIGVLLPDLRNPFYEGVVESLQNQADAMDLLPLVATTLQDNAREQLVIRRFRELCVSGIVVVSPAISQKTLRDYAQHIPLVTIGLQKVGGLVDSVHVDEAAAAKLVMEHVRSLGYSKIAHYSRPDIGRDGSIECRRDMLRQAAKSAGMQMTIDHEVEKVIKKVKTNKNIAIVTHDDMRAIHVVAALRGYGIQPGKDVAVVGYDDSYLAQLPEFNLTSVDQNYKELGLAAIQMLLTRRQNLDLPGRERITIPKLSIRGSSSMK